MININININKDISIPQVGRLALLLALTTSQQEEDALKDKLLAEGFLCAVTGAGGYVEDMKSKINLAILGATLNNRVIDKNPEEIHAVIHAALEAKSGMLMEAPSGANLAVKIAIVRKDRWLAVAIYGHSAMHTLTNHERAGLGIMHI